MPHLKEGYVISIGRKNSQLVNIETRDETVLPLCDLKSLQAVALGLPIENTLLFEVLKNNLGLVLKNF